MERALFAILFFWNIMLSLFVYTEVATKSEVLQLSKDAARAISETRQMTQTPIGKFGLPDEFEIIGCGLTWQEKDGTILKKEEYNFTDGEWLPWPDPAIIGPPNAKAFKNLRYSTGHIEGDGYTRIVNAKVQHSKNKP